MKRVSPELKRRGRLKKSWGNESKNGTSVEDIADGQCHSRAERRGSLEIGQWRQMLQTDIYIYIFENIFHVGFFS